MLKVLVVVTVVVVGLMVGVEFAVAVFVNPILNQLPGEASLAARSHGARVLGTVMPVWYISSLMLGSLWAALMWARPQALPVTVAVALLVVSVVMSVLLLVPINSRVARWSADSLPPDWRAQVTRWDRFHSIRVTVIVAAFALLVIATVGS